MPRPGARRSVRQTEFGMKFDEIKKKDGLGAALKWRAAQFKE